MKQDIKSMTIQELTAVFQTMGEAAYRAKQVFVWLYKGVTSFEEMTNISKPLRQRLNEDFFITVPEVARKQVSKKDGTIKYLWRLGDGNCVETVLMRYRHGNSVCISSEVGCPMGCAFCASTLGGLIRRLKPSEMLDQVMFTALDSGLDVSNIVLMGIGEPLDNYDTVMRFLEIVNYPDGLNIGMRHISLSTCGLCDRIEDLAAMKTQITLSVSLHAPTDEIRNTIMPVNRKYPVDMLLQCCRDYFNTTGRRISFEYAMIRDVNDSVETARILAAKLSGMTAHVNLIPLNNVEESPLKPSTRKSILEFQSVLQDAGITTTVRRTLGSDIDASCGQLRRKYEN